jgi:hypothetical protein
MIRKPGWWVSEGKLEAILALRTTYDNRDDMIARIEEEEFADDEGLDQHDRARRNDGKQTNYVEDSNDVEDNVAGTSQ